MSNITSQPSPSTVINDLAVFENDQFGSVRTTVHDGEPWFVAADVCRALDTNQPTRACERLDEDEKGVRLIHTPLIDPTVNTEQLTPIEVALALDKNGCTTARKLYAWLELDETHYSRWVKVNLLENVYAEEGTDYSPLKASKKRGRGQFAQDYTITATFSKKLAMTCPTERGEQARIYFLMAEKIAAEKKHTEEVRKEGIIVRRTLTDALVHSGEMERMKGHAPSAYTDMIYKAVFGLSAKQLRVQRCITGNLRDFLTADELDVISNMEQLVVAFLANGCQYNDIKSHLMQMAAAKQKRLSA